MFWNAPCIPMTWRQAFWTLVKFLCVLLDSVTTPPRHKHTSFYVRMWSYSWVHINDFYADGVDMVVMEITVICLSCIPEEKPGRPLSWVDTVLSLVLRRDGRVRYGMRGYVAWCFYLLVEVYFVMLIMQKNIWTSWVDRRSSLVPVTPILVSYYHSSLQQVGYGSVSSQPLS